MSASPSRVRGVGLGLRWELAEALLERLPTEVDFLEISPENYARRGGAAARLLARARAAYPIVTHGLAMSLGGVDPLDDAHLDGVGAIVHAVGSPFHSDHACMSAHGGHALHDLLPVPLTRAAADHMAARVKEASRRLGVPMAIENVSFYAHTGAPELSEPAFIRRVCERAECGWLFDVNNAFVNATNFGTDPRAWLDEAPLERVVQMHVAGHEWFDFADGELHPLGPTRPNDVVTPRRGERLAIDTHGQDTPDPVLALLREVLLRTGLKPIVLERDQNIPPLDVLLAEFARVRAVVASIPT